MIKERERRDRHNSRYAKIVDTTRYIGVYSMTYLGWCPQGAQWEQLLFMEVEIGDRLYLDRI